jgi:hypothetical protein
MTLWSRLFRAGAASQLAAAANANLGPPTRGAPSTVWVVPRRLSVTYYLHDIEGTELFTAVSNGLRAHQQREIVVTVRTTPGDDLAARMRELGGYFKLVMGLAREGQRVTVGGFSHFKSRGLFGRADSGLLYAEARPLRGVELPSQALAAIAVDGAEVRAAIDHGAYRVLTRIGEIENRFPFPTWSDLSRKSVVNEREGESLLSKVPRLRVAGVSFLAEDKRIRVFIAPSAREAMGRGIAPLKWGAPFAFLTEPAAAANALLIWHPGQVEPAIISRSGTGGTRTSGSCLMVVPGGKNDEARLFEDGYTLLFSTKSWDALCAALLKERPYSLELAGGGKLEFSWMAVVDGPLP